LVARSLVIKKATKTSGAAVATAEAEPLSTNMLESESKNEEADKFWKVFESKIVGVHRKLGSQKQPENESGWDA